VERFRFWPFLFGVLVLVWGTATLVSRLLGIAIDISWWAVFAIVVGVWFLTYAIRKPELQRGPREGSMKTCGACRDILFSETGSKPT
jgi:hypothetical protein